MTRKSSGLCLPFTDEGDIVLEDVSSLYGNLPVEVLEALVAAVHIVCSVGHTVEGEITLHGGPGRELVIVIANTDIGITSSLGDLLEDQSHDGIRPRSSDIENCWVVPLEDP